jgi:adenine-specific DNA-methyltransferase
MTQNLLTQLTDLLKQIPDYTDGENLLKNKIIEDGLKCDPQLITALLKVEQIKKHFFVEATGDILVFDSLKFQQFVGAKQFLPDSYTAFSNKIGLTDDTGDLMSANKSVVLDFPYKDCVLEGGQTKDDTKRKEIFWNQTLAPDQIDVLLEPKLLTGHKRYTSNKTPDEHLFVEAVTPPPLNKPYFNRNEEGTITDNLIIKGNNLLALHSLKAEFKGKVKLIYIDPPYNTGSDSFGYNDKFNHSTWLVFMKNRLEVARELLRDDGVIFVQCDDNEQAYLKVLMDEVFTDGFISTIIVKSSTPSGTKTAHKEKTIIKQKDTIHFYKKKTVQITPQYAPRDKWDTHYSLYLEGKEGSYTLKPLLEILTASGFNYSNLSEINPLEDKIRKFYVENKDKIIRLQSHKNTKAEKISREDFVDKIYYDKSTSGILNGMYYNGQVITQIQQGIKKVVVNKKLIDCWTILLCDLWVDIDFQNTQNEGGVSLANGKKPESLIQRIIEMSTNPNDIVLDYHLGSGTTAAVAHKMGRQYIGVEQMDYIQDISCVRMQKVLDGEQGGISKSVNWQGGGSFVYLELREYNQAFVKKIEEAKNTKELLKIWQTMQSSGFISYKVDPKSFEENIEEFEALSLDNQKKFLLEVLDKNLMYINKSERNNGDYEVSDEEKVVNEEFYKLKVK